MTLEKLILQATDESLLGEENWDLTMQIVDKLDAKPHKARKAVSLFLNRLNQKSQNIILVTLKVVDACVKNCSKAFHLEVASKTLMNLLVRLLSDAAMHEKVKQKIRENLGQWEREFGHDASLDIVRDTCEKLRRQGFEIGGQRTMPNLPPRAASNVREEEEELQLALALSMADVDVKKQQQQQQIQRQRTESVNESLSQAHRDPYATSLASASASTASGSRVKSSRETMHVKALYDFKGTEEDELPFKQGDTIRVLDSSHKDWWKGTLHGKTGLFPRNYTSMIQAPVDARPMSREEEQLIDTIQDFVASLNDEAGSESGLSVSTDPDDPLQKKYFEALLQRPKLIKRLQTITEQRDELESLSKQLKSALETYQRLYTAAQSTPSYGYYASGSGSGGGNASVNVGRGSVVGAGGSVVTRLAMPQSTPPPGFPPGGTWIAASPSPHHYQGQPPHAYWGTSYPSSYGYNVWPGNRPPS